MSKLGTLLQPAFNVLYRAVASSSVETETSSLRPLHGSNPHLGRSPRRSYYSADVERLLSGWTTSSAEPNDYLQRELPSLISRSREAARQNGYAKRFIRLIKSNVIGDTGITFQSQKLKRNGDTDVIANKAITDAFKEWSSGECDYEGNLTLHEIEELLVSTTAIDGSYFVRVFEGAQYGKFGLRLKVIDTNHLNLSKTGRTEKGEIKLGVEYNKFGRIIRYHFKEPYNKDGNATVREYSVDAKYIIHDFLVESVGQATGTPWMHAGLERLKHLGKYNESAMVAARYGASKMMFLSSDGTDQGKYKGDDIDGDTGDSIDSVVPGSISDIGARSIETFDPKYPHEMYAAFVKAHLREIASAWNISYASLASDLEDVNYSSIRAGLLEDRDMYKALQEWFVKGFRKRITERWFTIAMMKGAVVTPSGLPLTQPISEYIKTFGYQPRRWAWTDPQKDTSSNVESINARIKSRGQVIREQGGDPEKIWAEMKEENEMLKEFGLLPTDDPTEKDKDNEGADNDKEGKEK